MNRFVSLQVGLAFALGGLAVLPLAGCGASGDASADEASRHAGESSVTGSAGSDSLLVATASSNNAPPVDELMRQAADEGKYLFAFVWSQDDEPTRQMRQVFDSALEACSTRARGADVLISAANQQAFIKEYGLQRAPMPLVLSIAPNGAITGGFTNPFSKDDLRGAFATPATEESMKHLQAGKMVLVCIQNESSANQETALAAARSFQSDDRFAQVSAIVLLDPADPAEASFLRDLEVTSTDDAVTVVLAPPGSTVAKFEGGVSRDQIVDAVTKAQSACCPGGQCGPGGCKPQ